MSKSFAVELEVIANSLNSGDAANNELSVPAIAEPIAKACTSSRTRWPFWRFPRNAAI
jgi:hypothetical protein